MEKAKRISTGVRAIDSMVEGGIPEGSVIGVTGPAGVGKSILALQFIHEGALMNEKSIYINLEEPRHNIDRTLQSLSFGKSLIELEKKGLVTVLCLNYSEFEKVYHDVFSKIENDKSIKRIVIDSFNCFFSYMNLEKAEPGSNVEIRKMLSQSFALFRKKDFSTMLILESASNSASPLNNYVEYMVDGLIHLDFLSFGTTERRIFIPKMRWTSQYNSSLGFEVTRDGIRISSDQ